MIQNPPESTNLIHTPNPPASGSILEITINKIGTQGDGIGQYGDFLVIVPKTAVGDHINCKIKYVTSGRIHADLTNIIKSSPDRIQSNCEYYETCGGCGLQHINETTYKSYKLEQLTTAMKYNGLPSVDIGWFSVGEYSRRRAFIRFDENGNFGFYEHQTHNVININKCLILDKEIGILLEPLRNLSKKLTIKIDGWMITNTDSGIDLLLTSEDKNSKSDSAVTKTLSDFADTYNIARIGWKNGAQITPIKTNRSPALNIGSTQITLPQEYFLQASKLGQEALIKAVTDNVPVGAKILDLYSGVGVYSFALSGKAKHISAFEIAPSMIEAMKDNIAKHNLNKIIDANCRNIEKNPLKPDELRKFDTAIINPPRTGALKQVTAIAQAKIPLVIIVSCNSQTFARDGKVLHDAGYKLKSVDAIDQFYYSHHLEQVGVFIRELY